MSDEYKKIDVEFSKAEGEEGKVKAVFSVFNALLDEISVAQRSAATLSALPEMIPC